MVDEKTRWTTLRPFGESALMKLTVLAPFIGHILLSEFSSKYLEISQDFLKVDPLGSTLRLYMLYFGLVFLGVASVSYSSLCPKIIKNHRRDVDFLQNSRAITSPMVMKTFARQAVVAANTDPKTMKRSRFLKSS